MNFKNLIKGAQRIPVTSAVILLGVLGYLAVVFDSDIRPLLFYPPHPSMGASGYLRLLTPTFLHFHPLHILFNALWIWEFGRRIELYCGSIACLLLFLITALAANFTQFYSSGIVAFGGLSGVVYGYLGFLFIARRAVPSPLFRLPIGLFVAMLVFLLLGYLGVIGFLMGAGIANGAHLGGLLSGLLCGLVYFYRDIDRIVGIRHEPR